MNLKALQYLQYLRQDSNIKQKHKVMLIKDYTIDLSCISHENNISGETIKVTLKNGQPSVIVYNHNYPDKGYTPILKRGEDDDLFETVTDIKSYLQMKHQYKD